MNTKLLNRNFAKVSLLTLIIVLVLSSISYISPFVYSQSGSKLIGAYTLKWTLTATGTFSDTYKYQQGDYKNTDEIKDEQTITTNGELKGSVFDISNQYSHDITYDSLEISSTIAGGVTEVQTIENIMWCEKTGKKGEIRSEAKTSTTYSVKTPPNLLDDFNIPNLGKLEVDDIPNDIKYHINYLQSDAEEGWLITETGTYIKNWRDECGQTGTETKDILKDHSNSTNSAVNSALYELFHKDYEGLFAGVLSNQGGNIYSITKTESFPYTRVDGRYKWESNAQITYTLTYEDHPSNLEVVIITPDNYSSWLPEGGINEKVKGNDVLVSAELKIKGHPDLSTDKKAKFTFELVNTSHERGVCLNVPEEKLADKTNPLDMKFDESNSNFTVANNGQQAISKKSDFYAEIRINNYDWGARTQLKVTAILDDDNQKLIGHLDSDRTKDILDIPMDKNQNFIADAWEIDEGIYEKNLKAEWNEIDTPKGHKTEGDGISLYERYRGFRFYGNYERLKTDRKYIFIHDPDDIVFYKFYYPETRHMSFQNVSNCNIRYLDKKEWSGSGAFDQKKRIVNFNYGTAHIIDQHGLEVRNDKSNVPDVPQAYKDLYKRILKTEYTEKLEGDGEIIKGFAPPDPSSSLPYNSPDNCYRIQIFTNRIQKIVYDEVCFHTLGLAEWAGKELGSLTPEEEKRLNEQVNSFIREHKAEWLEAILKHEAHTIAHELGHGLGVKHHDPATLGYDYCVMLYFTSTKVKNPNDRFALGFYQWPYLFCEDEEPEFTNNGRGCRIQIKVTDEPRPAR